MKTMRLFLVFPVVACLLWGGTVRGDTFKLKNGTSVEGDVVTETDTEYTVEQARAGGSIRTRTSVLKADVAEIVKTTAEKKAERVYQDTLRYKLDPNQSYTKDYYDRVLEGVFRKFLTDCPQSAFDKEMKDRIAEWEKERDKVAAGYTKQDGRWVFIVDQLLAQAQSSLTAHQYPQAAQFIQQLLNTNPSGDTDSKAKEIRKEIYQQWLQSLQQEKLNLQDQLAGAEKKMQKAQEDLAKARADLTKSSFKGMNK